MMIPPSDDVLRTEAAVIERRIHKDVVLALTHHLPAELATAACAVGATTSFFTRWEDGALVGVDYADSVCIEVAQWHTVFEVPAHGEQVVAWPDRLNRYGRLEWQAIYKDGVLRVEQDPENPTWPVEQTGPQAGGRG